MILGILHFGVRKESLVSSVDDLLCMIFRLLWCRILSLYNDRFALVELILFIPDFLEFMKLMDR